MLDETKAGQILKRAFEGAGYRMQERVHLRDAGHDLDIWLAGWDADKKVGYCFIFGDRPEIHEAHMAELESRIEASHLHVLLVDEMDAVDASHLEEAAAHFIKAVEAR